MTLSSRRFLIAQDGVLYRLADATFTRMLRNPGSHAFPVLAGQRVRMASLIVELVGGAPVRVVRNTYAILSFNDDGHMDSDMFTRQQWALAESAVDPALSVQRMMKRFWTRLLGSSRKGEDRARQPPWRAPPTRPRLGKSTVVGCSETVV